MSRSARAYICGCHPRRLVRGFADGIRVAFDQEPEVRISLRPARGSKILRQRGDVGKMEPRCLNGQLPDRASGF